MRSLWRRPSASVTGGGRFLPSRLACSTARGRSALLSGLYIYADTEAGTSRAAAVAAKSAHHGDFPAANVLVLQLGTAFFTATPMARIRD